MVDGRLGMSGEKRWWWCDDDDDDDGWPKLTNGPVYFNNIHTLLWDSIVGLVLNEHTTNAWAH